MRVHVVSYSPATDDVGVGGFDWSYQLDDALDTLCERIDEEEGDYHLALVHLDVPDGLTADEITDWIDSHLELIEPRGNRDPLPAS